MCPSAHRLPRPVLPRHLRDYVAACRRRSRSPQRVIRRSDSVATLRSILDSPRTRSTNSIGTSTRQAGLQGPPGQVGLEDVAGRLHALEVDRLQRAAPEQPVARGHVAHRDAEQQPGVDVAAHRERLAAQRPVDHRPAAHPPRPDHQVGVLAARRAATAAARAGASRRRPSPRPRRSPRSSATAKPCRYAAPRPGLHGPVHDR